MVDKLADTIDVRDAERDESEIRFNLTATPVTWEGLTPVEGS